jgi:hypothetical protein
MSLGRSAPLDSKGSILRRVAALLDNLLALEIGAGAV